MLQDIIFVGVVVLAFIAFFRASERIVTWLERRHRKSSPGSNRQRDADKE
jgi:hypothetical protein